MRFPSLVLICAGIAAAGTGAGCGGDKHRLPIVHFSDAGPDATVNEDASPDPDAGPPDTSGEVFSMDALHRIDLTVEPGDLERLDPLSVEPVTAVLTFDDETVGEIRLRLHGDVEPRQNLTGKPGFSIRMDTVDPTRRLHGLRRLLLGNFQEDPSMLGTHLGYELYRRVGLPTPRTAYAVVSVNDEYYGLYLLVEPVDEVFAGRAFGDGTGNLYQGPCCGELSPKLTVILNEDAEGRDTSDFSNLFTLMWYWPDGRFMADFEEVVDEDAFIQSWAVEALVGYTGGYAYGPGRFYMYGRPADRRLVFLPSGVHGMAGFMQDLYFEVETPPPGRVARRLNGILEGYGRYVDALRGTLADVWDVDALRAFLGEADALVGITADADPRAWRSAGDRAVEVARLFDFIADRPDVIRQMLDSVCGDGNLELSEACDDGNFDLEDGCNARCVEERCGDRILQLGLGEVCDDRGCAPGCLGNFVCGDGTVDPGETCDGGDVVDGDGCSSVCREDRCGDFLLSPSNDEVCDGLRCRADCSAVGTCGDAVTDVGEDCDDANVDDTDGCLADCSFGDCEEVAGAGGRYVYCTHERTQDAARARCLVMGGTLALPRNTEENDAVKVEAVGRDDGAWWIGFDDLRVEGAFRDPQGLQVRYLPWGRGQPNGGVDQGCGTMEPRRFDGGWNDKACGEEHPMVCWIPDGG